MSFFWFLSGILWLLEEQARDPFKGEVIEDGWMCRDVQREPSSLQSEADTCFKCLNTLREEALTSRCPELHPLYTFLTSFS